MCPRQHAHLDIFLNELPPTLINIYDEQSSLPINPDRVRLLATHFLMREKQICHEVCIHFVDTPTICSLHEEYFGDPSVTDCISFPIDEAGTPYRILGEVFVCPQTAVDRALTHAIDPDEETALYTLHGLLHLIGYDDQEPKAKAKMRRKERRYMAEFKTLAILPITSRRSAQNPHTPPTPY